MMEQQQLVLADKMGLVAVVVVAVGCTEASVADKMAWLVEHTTAWVVMVEVHRKALACMLALVEVVVVALACIVAWACSLAVVVVACMLALVVVEASLELVAAACTMASLVDCMRAFVVLEEQNS